VAKTGDLIFLFMESPNRKKADLIDLAKALLVENDNRLTEKEAHNVAEYDEK
jgi:hypothetical protein